MLCTAPKYLLDLGSALPRTARKLALGGALTVVAFGSSSTEGAGGSAPDKCYPARLEVELQARFPGKSLRVLNRGIGGEDAREMLARFERHVLAQKPDLLLWQLGTNVLVQDRTIEELVALLRDGFRRLAPLACDVVLIDPQYAPEILPKPGLKKLLALFETVAREHGAGLFRRFAIMQHWHEAQGVPIEASIGEDGLHMTDWSYGCFATLLAQAITDAVQPRGCAVN